MLRTSVVGRNVGKALVYCNAVKFTTETKPGYLVLDLQDLQDLQGSRDAKTAAVSRAVKVATSKS